MRSEHDKRTPVVAAFDVGKSVGVAIFKLAGTPLLSVQGEPKEVFSKVNQFVRKGHVIEHLVIEGSFGNRRSSTSNWATWYGGFIHAAMWWTGLYHGEPTIIFPSAWRVSIGIALHAEDPSLPKTKAGTIRKRKRKSPELNRDSVMVASEILDEKLRMKDIHRADAACLGWVALREAASEEPCWPGML